MSVTSPTLIPSPAGAAVVAPPASSAVVAAPVGSSSSLPQPASAKQRHCDGEHDPENRPASSRRTMLPEGAGFEPRPFRPRNR